MKNLTAYQKDLIRKTRDEISLLFKEQDVLYFKLKENLGDFAKDLYYEDYLYDFIYNGTHDGNVDVLLDSLPEEE